MRKTLRAATTILTLSTFCLVLVYTPSPACPPAAVQYSQSYQVAPAAVVSYQVAPAVASYQVATVQKAFAKQQANYSYQQPAASAYVQPEFYSSVQDYYQQKVLLDAVTGRFTDALKLQEELQSLRSQVQQLQAPPQYQPLPSYAPQQQQYHPQRQQQQYQPQPQQQRQQQPRRLPAQAPQTGPPESQPPTQPPPPQQPPPPPPEQQTQPPPEQLPPPQEQPEQYSHNHGRGDFRSTVPEKLHSVVSTSCVRCHGDNNSRQGGGVDLRNLETVDRETRLLAFTSTLTGDMPRGGKKLSEEERAEFLEWYRMARSAGSTQARR